METNMNNMNNMSGGIGTKLLNATAACLVAASLLAIGISDASAGARGGGGGGGARAGGGGGGRMAQSSVSGANRSMSGGGGSYNRGSGNAGNVNTGNVNRGNVNTGNVNRGNVNTGNVNTGNVNRGNVNIGNDVNIDIDGGYNHGCCHGGYHPIAAGVAIGAIAVTTAAVMGSYYYALPPSGCSIVYRNGVSYHYCGSVYYQQSYSGNDVVYVVVNP
jgi:hypothetical protein